MTSDLQSADRFGYYQVAGQRYGAQGCDCCVGRAEWMHASGARIAPQRHTTEVREDRRQERIAGFSLITPVRQVKLASAVSSRPCSMCPACLYRFCLGVVLAGL